MDNKYREVLNANEEISYVAKLHWVIFFTPIKRLVILGAFFWVFNYIAKQLAIKKILPLEIYAMIENYGPLVMTVLLLLFVAWPLARALALKLYTRYIITNQRVIYYYKLVTIKTDGMPLDKIENVKASQTIRERILGYGDIYLIGAGGTSLNMDDISKPMAFRNHLADIIGK